MARKKKGGKRKRDAASAEAEVAAAEALDGVTDAADPDRAETVIDVPDEAGDDRTVLRTAPPPASPAPADPDAPDDVLWGEDSPAAPAASAAEDLEEIPELPELPEAEPEPPPDVEGGGPAPSGGGERSGPAPAKDDPASASDTLPPLDELADAPGAVPAAEPTGLDRAAWIEQGLARARDGATAAAERVGMALLGRDPAAERAPEHAALWARAAALRDVVAAHTTRVRDARAAADDAADAFEDARRDAAAHERRRDQALEQLQVALRTLGEHLVSAHRAQLVAVAPTGDDDPRLPALAALEEADEAEAELQKLSPPPPRKGLTRLLGKAAPDPRTPLQQVRDAALARFRDLVRGLARDAFPLVDAVGATCEACAAARARVEEHSTAAQHAVQALRALDLAPIRRAAEDATAALDRLSARVPDAIREWGAIAPEVGRVHCERRLAAGLPAEFADEREWRDARAAVERFQAYATALAAELQRAALGEAEAHAARVAALVQEARSEAEALEAQKGRARDAAHQALAAWSKRERDVVDRAAAAEGAHAQRLEATALAGAAALARVEAGAGALEGVAARVDAAAAAVERAVRQVEALRARLPELQAAEQETEAIVKAVKTRAAKAVKEFEEWIKAQARKLRGGG